MKKFLALLLTLALCLAPCALAEPVSEEEQTARVEAMLPVLDSLLRTIHLVYEDEVLYDPIDPEYFWSVLYLMGVNWSLENPLCSLTEDGASLRVPTPVMQEYASAAFLAYADMENLPFLPETSVVTYDEGWDAYLVPMATMGEIHTVINGTNVDEDGTLWVYASLADENEASICSMMFSLVENPFVDGIVEPTFWYSVSSVLPAAG